MTAGVVDLLVVGAGPTGLALALQAHDHGARVGIVERRPEAFRPSRALIVHPRTLEVLRPLGVTDALLARGHVAPCAQLHLAGRVVEARLGPFDLADTAFPHLLLIGQAQMERVLAGALADRGVEVERGRELLGIVTGEDHVVGRVGAKHPTTDVDCRFLAGCDGPISTMPTRMGIAWRGGPYRPEVVLADVELDADLDLGAAHAVPAPQGLVFLFPLGERATWRLMATRPAGSDDLPDGEPGLALSSAHLQAILDDAGLAARISDVRWCSRIRLLHRLAGSYRCGPVFLAGDAAHAHSPAGGQGMNTGIQDATNLG